MPCKHLSFDVCDTCRAGIKDRHDEEVAEILSQADQDPPAYEKRPQKPPTYAEVEKEKRIKEQYEIMKADMRKNCHQIVGESDRDYGARRMRWQLAIDRKFLELHDGVVRGQKNWKAGVYPRK